MVAPHAVRPGRQRNDGRPESTGARSAPRPNSAIGPRASRTANFRPGDPPRPQGIERNVVITQWDWADPKAYLHDEISTDKRDPHVNANGLIYGSPEESRDYLPVLDPVHNTIAQVKIPYRDPDTPGQPKPLQPSTFWGDDPIWDSHTTVHNPMFDQQGRLWYTSRIRASERPRVLQGRFQHRLRRSSHRSIAPAASWPCTIRKPRRPR